MSTRVHPRALALVQEVDRVQQGGTAITEFPTWLATETFGPDAVAAALRDGLLRESSNKVLWLTARAKDLLGAARVA